MIPEANAKLEKHQIEGFINRISFGMGAVGSLSLCSRKARLHCVHHKDGKALCYRERELPQNRCRLGRAVTCELALNE